MQGQSLCSSFSCFMVGWQKLGLLTLIASHGAQNHNTENNISYSCPYQIVWYPGSTVTVVCSCNQNIHYITLRNRGRLQQNGSTLKKVFCPN